MNPSDLARHIWGEGVKGETLRLRKRTIRRWESEGQGPVNPLIRDRLQSLINDNDKAPTEPKRKPVGGMLPSMGLDEGD